MTKALKAVITLNPMNKMASKSQHTPGIEGRVFDGTDGSQIVFWTYRPKAKSE